MGNRTKREILRAFNELMTQRPIDKISVDDICEAADISRSTFYRQFRDKYDVLTYNFQKTLDQYFAPGVCTTLEDVFEKVLADTQAIFSTFKDSFGRQGPDSLNSFIYSYCLSALENYISAKRPATEQERLQINTLCLGLSYLGNDWTSGKYDLSPKEAASALYELVPESLKGPLWE